MKFTRPVEHRYPICANFKDWGMRWELKVDPVNGLWIPKGSMPDALGQHRGVDFDCPPGTIVSAMCDGFIVKAGYTNPIRHDESEGLHIIQLVTDHPYLCWWIHYSHLRSLLVGIGAEVRRGQPLGETGRSGNTREPILHVDLADTKKPRQYHPIHWSTNGC